MGGRRVLEISASIFEAFAAERRSRAIDQIALAVVRRGRLVVTPQSDWRGAVDRAVASARTYGISSARAFGIFAGISILIGPDFHRHPACSAALNYTRIHPDRRVDLLFDLQFRAVWAELCGPVG